MAFSTIPLLLLFGTSFTFADDQKYNFIQVNDNCPDFSRSLGDGCTISDDCTKLTCTENSLGDKELTLTIKINKCDDPPTVKATVEALGFSWSHTFDSSNNRIAIPGLSIKPVGKLLSAGVYLKVVLEDNGSNLKLKIIILTGIEVLGEFKTITSSTLANSDLPISTYECGIVRWWNSLSWVIKCLVVGGGVVFIIIIAVACCCCCRCCGCGKKSNGGVVVVAPAPAVTVTSTKSNVPMQPFVNEV